MAKKPLKPTRGSTAGNFIAEWFGRRVWDSVDRSLQPANGHASKECPFLTASIGREQVCIKSSGRANPTGVCVISSDANGIRQDWLACPYRTLDKNFTLIKEAIHLLFGIAEVQDVLILSGEKIKTHEGQGELKDGLGRGLRCFVFLANKLGGEVDLPETVASPGSKVDVSIIEVLQCDGVGRPNAFGSHVFFEIQTADFHGSPLHAVSALEALADANARSEDFYNALVVDIEICGLGVEGPNKSNVFKRTFYQAVLKIRLAEAEDSGGFVLIIPTAVWESWLKHLGNPTLRSPQGRKTALARTPEEHDELVARSKSWIFVFDIDRASNESPNPLIIRQMVAVSTDTLLHFAFDEAAAQARALQVIERYRGVLIERITSAWGQKGARRRARNKKE